MSWTFVVRWTQSLNQNCEDDNRGWEKGKSRKHNEYEKELIEKVRKELEESENEFYIGPKTILRKIKQSEYNDKEKIYLPFIKRTLKEAGLSKPHKKKKKGLSRYQHYPVSLINEIGPLIVEIDFLERCIKGRTKPVNFTAFSCKKLNLRQFKRISAQTGACGRTEIKWFFDNFFIPDAIKMDNCLAFIGSSSGKRSLSRTVKLLFQKQVIPIFTNPRSPWNNGSVEGSNSVFARNFWNKIIFNSVAEIDKNLKLFNQSSLENSNYDQQEFQQEEKKRFIPKIYFIRKVCDDQQIKNGKISILNETINLPKDYINLFTLSEWNLKTEMLTVFFENEQTQNVIKKIKFKINRRSRVGVSTFI